PPKQGNGKDQKEIKLPEDPVAFANWFYNTMDWQLCLEFLFSLGNISAKNFVCAELAT
ncbi:MAG: hypothetical protein HY747_08735, partial [Elusimicrobia bacterium]|nr:hypothetical protein [Elusimicrobiota bacterium]